MSTLLDECMTYRTYELDRALDEMWMTWVLKLANQYIGKQSGHQPDLLALAADVCNLPVQ